MATWASFLCSAAITSAWIFWYFSGLLETFKFYETLVQEELFQIDPMLAPTPHVIPKYQQFPAGDLAMETQGTWGWRFDYGPDGATPMDNITEKVGT